MKPLGKEDAKVRAPRSSPSLENGIGSNTVLNREPRKVSDAQVSGLMKESERPKRKASRQPNPGQNCQPLHSTLLASQNGADIGQIVRDTQRAVLKERNAEIGKMRAQWRQEVEELAERERKLEQSERELRMENIHLILARQERERAGKDPLETKLYLLNADLWAFDQRVRKMEELNRFTHPDLEAERSFESEKIDDLMDQMGSELESITISSPIIGQSLASDSDLGSLIRTASADGVGRGGEIWWLRNCVSKFDSEIGIRVLVLGAVRDWVFGAKFPDFTPIEMRLLGAYREVVISYGEKACWNKVTMLTSFRWLGQTTQSRLSGLWYSGKQRSFPKR
jgi:hypothetical protein